MLDKIGQYDYSESASQKISTERVENKNMSNPYAKEDKGLFIDESRISDEAIKLYERENDVRRFAQLTLSDRDDTSSNSIVLQKAFGGELSVDNDEAVFSLLDNEKFLNDIEF